MSGSYKLSTHQVTLVFNRRVSILSPASSFNLVANDGHLQGWSGTGSGDGTTVIQTVCIPNVATGLIPNTVNFDAGAFSDLLSGEFVPGVTDFPIAHL